jgi:RNA polymerase sigma-70 factor (ECF subfamily)
MEATLSASAELGAVVRGHRRHLFAVALARTGRVDVADDVVQTVLLRLVSRGSREDIRDLRAYLVRAVENQCRNVIARSRPEAPLPAEAPSSAEAPSRTVAQRELGEMLRTAIRGLPEAYRTAVWLVHVEGLAPGEVARATGSRLPTVKSALARGRRILRRRLGPVLRRAGYLESHEEDSREV